MKASDLQVGDLVYIFENPKKIEGIRIFKNGDEIVYYDGDNGNFIENVTPIPLTTEILEKNGFEKDRDYGYFIGQSNSGYYIYFNNNHLSIQAGYDAIEFAWCEYVHELQHVLKSCEIDKEIVI